MNLRAIESDLSIKLESNKTEEYKIKCIEKLIYKNTYKKKTKSKI